MTRGCSRWLATWLSIIFAEFGPRASTSPGRTTSRAETPAERLPSNAPGAFDRVLERERASHLAAALTDLPVIYREVLALRFEEEMKIEEIAQVLGAPLSTVKSRLRRSLEQMRQSLDTRYPGADWQ